MKKGIAILGIAALMTACGGKTETAETQVDSVATEVSVDSTATVSDTTAVEAPVSEETSAQ